VPAEEESRSEAREDANANANTNTNASPPGDLPRRVQVRAYSLPARIIAVTLQVVAVLNLLYITAHIVHDILEGTQTATRLAVALGLAVFSGVPWAAAALLRRLLAATVEIQPPLVVLTMRRARFEIPLASIVALRPFRLPLPGPGVALEMTSGRLFRHRLQLDDPGALLAALEDALPAARAAQGHASVAHARAKHDLGRQGLRRWLIKFGLFPLALTIVLFRLHQYIVYGGPFGEYRLHGLGAYLKTFAEFWAGTAGGLVVYASLVRLAAEAAALPLTWALPSRARLLRRVVEILCLIAYFGLIPAYVLFRLLE